jgi:hypothetical protein
VTGLLLAGLGLATLGAATLIALTQAGGGSQPWSAELADNVILARVAPFALAAGIAFGLVRGGRPVALALLGVGLLLGIPTGTYEYLGGLLDHKPPFPLYVVYRIHYIAAVFLLFAVGALAVNVWRDSDRSFMVPRGQLRRYLRGLADELPPFLVRPLAGPLGIDLKAPAPPRDRYTFYETVVSYPWWAIGLTLITVTGLVKALRYLYPVPGPVLFMASTLHVAAMVILALKVLDQLRITLEIDRKVAVGVLAALWAVASLAIAYWMVTSAFMAQTAVKEGILAQIALFLGGLGTLVLALLVLRQFALMFRRRTAG